MPTPTLTGLGPPPITFQDFLKEVDLQFLDHMRRGTSINFADLASDPPPANVEVWLLVLTKQPLCPTVPAPICH
jgi:hypothetical protein